MPAAMPARSRRTIRERGRKHRAAVLEVERSRRLRVRIHGPGMRGALSEGDRPPFVLVDPTGRGRDHPEGPAGRDGAVRGTGPFGHRLAPPSSEIRQIEIATHMQFRSEDDPPSAGTVAASAKRIDKASPEDGLCSGTPHGLHRLHIQCAREHFGLHVGRFVGHVLTGPRPYRSVFDVPFGFAWASMSCASPAP